MVQALGQQQFHYLKERREVIFSIIVQMETPIGTQRKTLQGNLVQILIVLMTDI